MELLLVRYSEIGLKSTPVRRRFEGQLKENMISMLSRDGIEAIVTSGDARFFVGSDDIDAAAVSVSRVFGVASLSKVMTSGADIHEICDAAAEYSKGKLEKGMSFAVRARREGEHEYTSMDLGREAGSAIFLANPGVRVDLTSPDVTFYIEVRNNKAFIFNEYIPGPGGLPLGSQGRVLAVVENERGVLSAWLMMKRGCRTMIQGDRTPFLEKFDPSLRYVSSADEAGNVLGIVLGTSLGELDSVVIDGNMPIYFPTIGMSDAHVKETLNKIK